MKHILRVLLIVSVLLVIVGCTSSPTDDNESTKDETEQATKAQGKVDADAKQKEIDDAEAVKKKDAELEANKPVLPAGCVDINTASVDELQEIEHIGPDRASSIINARPFNSVESLTSIEGIAQGRMADILAQNIACAS